MALARVRLECIALRIAVVDAHLEPEASVAVSRDLADGPSGLDCQSQQVQPFDIGLGEAAMTAGRASWFDRLVATLPGTDQMRREAGPSCGDADRNTEV